MLGHDLRLALLDGRPIQLARVHAFDTEFFRLFQVVPELGIEQQGLGRDAADVQAGAAEHVVLLDECGFQSILAGADGGGVAGRTTADDGDVINGFRQRSVPHYEEMLDGKRLILEQEGSRLR